MHVVLTWYAIKRLFFKCKIILDLNCFGKSFYNNLCSKKRSRTVACLNPKKGSVRSLCSLVYHLQMLRIFVTKKKLNKDHGHATYQQTELSFLRWLKNRTDWIKVRYLTPIRNCSVSQNIFGKALTVTRYLKRVLIKILLTHNFTVIKDEEAISIFSVGGLICLFAEQTKVL